LNQKRSSVVNTNSSSENYNKANYENNLEFYQVDNGLLEEFLLMNEEGLKITQDFNKIKQDELFKNTNFFMKDDLTAEAFFQQV